jgi:hypothetical protein
MSRCQLPAELNETRKQSAVDVKFLKNSPAFGRNASAICARQPP